MKDNNNNNTKRININISLNNCLWFITLCALCSVSIKECKRADLLLKTDQKEFNEFKQYKDSIDSIKMIKHNHVR